MLKTTKTRATLRLIESRMPRPHPEEKWVTRRRFRIFLPDTAKNEMAAEAIEGELES